VYEFNLEKLGGREESINPLWVWRYGFSHYTTGRVWILAVCASIQTEVRDRTMALAGPHSRLMLSLLWRRKTVYIDVRKRPILCKNHKIIFHI